MRWEAMVLVVWLLLNAGHTVGIVGKEREPKEPWEGLLDMVQCIGAAYLVWRLS